MLFKILTHCCFDCDNTYQAVFYFSSGVIILAIKIKNNLMEAQETIYMLKAMMKNSMFHPSYFMPNKHQNFY